jgi:hypothetical protein
MYALQEQVLSGRSRKGQSDRAVDGNAGRITTL